MHFNVSYMALCMYILYIVYYISTIYTYVYDIYLTLTSLAEPD